MQRRHFSVTALAFGLAFAGGALAQDAPIVKSGRILEALTKDVRLDDGGRPGTGRGRGIDLQVQFAFDSADLLPAGRRQLDELAFALSDRSLAGDAFEITGHTDRVGDAGYNLRLSQERAVAVKNYLVTMHGVSPARLRSNGVGFSQLADPRDPAAAINRRVEVRRIGASLQPRAVAPAIAPATGGRLVPTPQ
jgi:outer membrane protein OmpA-like peptidoglycan-associated protein